MVINKIPGWLKYSVPRQKKLTFELAFLLVSMVAIFCCLLPALRSAGWPQGTDFNNKTELYAKHFKHGDLLPIWSADDAYGLGTPIPLYYHKTYYYLSGTLLLLSHSIKLANILSVATFMLVGIYGMRFCLQKFTDNQIFIVLVAQILLFTNYAFTDWLVRDDMAEFAAMMLVPWVVWWCLNLLLDKRFSLLVMPILFLLINAHNVMALFGLELLITAYGIFLIREGRTGFRSTLKNALLSVGLLCVAMAPLLLVEKLFLRYYDPSKVTQAGYLATSNYVRFLNYLYTSHYTWLNADSLFSVQIDFGILIPFFIILAAFFITKFYRPHFLKLGKRLNRSVIIFLIVNLGFLIFLQLRASKPLYEALRPLQFLQFPWRILMYITVLGLILVAYIVSRYDKKIFLNCFAAAWLALFVVLSPAFKTLQHGYAYTRFSYAVPVGERHGYGSMLGIGEYLPRVQGVGTEQLSIDVLKLYRDKSVNHLEAETVSGGPCVITEHPAVYYESLTKQITVLCSTAAQIALPVSYNNLSTIRNVKNNQIIPYSRTTPTDPRIVLAIPPDKPTSLEIKLPSVPQLFKKLL